MTLLPLLAAALTLVAGLAVVALEGLGFVPAVHAAQWTARVMLPFFLLAFVVLGRRFDASVALRRAACRAAALSHAGHLVAVAFVVALEPPAAHQGGELLVEIGGGSAAAVILGGFWLWSRGWYRWLTFWPWGVFVFTYLFLNRLEDQAPRVSAAPLAFGPLLGVILAVLVVRLWSELGWTRE